VDYFACDVTDRRRVQAVMADIVRRYGKIDGVIHGAGILRDGWLSQMADEDFQAVTAVKLLGAWNLFKASEKAGLRFFVALSSVVAIQGNPGQANYCAANRTMSALLRQLRQQHQSLVFKALMLPPVAGTGMAADAEIRKILEKRKVGYLQPGELAGLFLRELLVAPPQDVWVLYMRELPALKNVLLDSSGPPLRPEELPAGAVAYPRKDFPLIDSVSHLDLNKGEMTAVRSFSRERDLWIADHKPFKFLKQPLISTIMALETFMEASRLLYPYLPVRGVREARFLEIIECPPGITRTAEINCHHLNAGPGEIVCELSMKTPDISPSGRVLERISLNYQAQVILGGAEAHRQAKLPGFPVRLEEFDTGPMNHQEILGYYQDRTDFKGRYLVLEHLEGSGVGMIRGRMIYRPGQDFSSPQPASLQYPVYLLEALMQMATFYLIMRNPREDRHVIPIKIGEMTFSRQCRDQETVNLEARLQAEDQQGLTWNARALDAEGHLLMQVRQLLLQWFSN
jgi:hypothetical protein